MKKTKIIFDTDIGSDIDDSFCLAYLLRHSACQLLGITTVSGQPEKRAMLASAICKHAGAQVPIHVGAEKPLLVGQFQPGAQQFSQIENWAHDKFEQTFTAVEFLRDTIMANPGEITLLAVGPLTNIALLFATYPQTAEQLKEIVIMGGQFIEHTLDAEWNIKCDPHAAQIVFNMPVQIRMIGLDVTLQVILPKAGAEEKCTAKALAPVMDFAKVWFEKVERVIFHDPLAATVVFKPELCEYKAGTVNVDLGKEPVLGKTFFAPMKNGRHLIATGVDCRGFFEEYFGVIEC